MAISEDASTPAVVQQFGDVTGITTTASFTPPANTLLVAVVIAAFKSTAISSITLSDSASGTWTQLAFIHNSADENVGIWSRPAVSSPGAITVTSTDTTTSQCGRELAVRVLDGAASSQAGAATATQTGSGTSLISNITTTQIGSWVYVVGALDTNTSYAVNGNTTNISTLTDGTDIESGSVGRQSSATVTPGSTALGWTVSSGAAWSWAAAEILSAGGGTPHTATGTLAVTPSFSLVKAEAHVESLNVQPAFAIVKAEAHKQSLAVTPRFANVFSHTGPGIGGAPDRHHHRTGPWGR